MTQPTTAVIVAGGRGTRLWPLTERTPKPLLPLVGIPFLRGVIERLGATGFRRVLLVVGQDTAPFDQVCSEAGRAGIEVEVVPEPTPLDTAGGVREVVDAIDGTFLVLNGDVLSGVDLDALVSQHRDAGAIATLSLIRVADTSTFGVCVREGSRIVDFVEKPAPGALPGQDAVNAGAYVLEPSALERFPRGALSFERQVFPGLVADGEYLLGAVTDATWADLGTPARYLHGHRLVLDHRVPWPSVADERTIHVGRGSEVADGATVTEPVWIGDEVSIAAGASIGPYAVIGDRCRLGARTQVRDAVLHDEATVDDHGHLDHAILGRGAAVGRSASVHGASIVGPHERIDPRARIGPDMRVGPEASP